MKHYLIILAAALPPLMIMWAGTKQATICTTYGADIYDYELDQMIDSVVPTSAKRLIVLTQCYGGNCLVPRLIDTAPLCGKMAFNISAYK